MSPSEDVKFSNVRGLYLRKYGRLSVLVVLFSETTNSGWSQTWGAKDGPVVNAGADTYHLKFQGTI